MRKKVGQRQKDWNVQTNGPLFASLSASQEHRESKRSEIIFLPSVDFGISFCFAHFQIRFPTLSPNSTPSSLLSLISS